MSDILDLKGRFAMVTGAGRGVGFQVASHFAKYNAGGIVINDFYQERAEAAVKELQAAGAKCKLVPISADITKLEDVQRMVATGEKEFGGPIQILVNNVGNAGVSAPSDRGRFADTDPSQWDVWLKPNLYGVMNCSHSVVKGMIDSQYGKIVTVISDAGRAPEMNLAVYGAAKAGAAALMRCLARELGRYNITCNSVALGATRTPATERLWENEEQYRKALRQYLLPRLGETTDAANMILFLSSDASSWVTGQVYPVNGGYTVTL